MIPDPSELFGYGLVYIRVGFFMFLVPFLGAKFIPVRGRVAFGLLLTVIITSIAPIRTFNEIDLASFVLFGFREAFIGALMGFAIKIAFTIIDFGSRQIATEIGLTMSQSINPAADGNSNTLQVVFHYFAVLLIFALGMHHEMIAAFINSFQIAPVGAFAISQFDLMGLLKESSGIFFVGLQIAAPFMAVSFLINVSFAVLGKIAPQVNVFMISFAVRIGVGFGIVIFTTPIISYVIVNTFQRTPKTIIDFITP